MGIKRFLKFNYASTSWLSSECKEIGKAVEVDITDPDKSFFYIEKMKNSDKYRITYSKGFLPYDISLLNNIEIIREN